MLWQVSAGALLGWSLGSNDAANVFGTAVTSHMVRFRTAALLCSGCVVLGALLEGQAGIETYRTLSTLDANAAFCAALGAGATVALMSGFGLPVSTSQAMVGALVVIGLEHSRVDFGALGKVVICWFGTPVGAALATVLLYHVLGSAMNRLQPTLFQYDRWLRWGLLGAGSYGSYALGANNVANVTGPFVGPGMLTPFQGCLLGSLAISVGVVTFSYRVMTTVGKDIVPLDAFTALVAILSEAITVHFYAVLGVPVSTSQAIVGAVLGVGIVKGGRLVNRNAVVKIAFGWLVTPAISALIAWLIYRALGALGVF